MSTASRRAKWRTAPPPHPSPKILHFPRIRRTRRRQTCAPERHRINPFLVLHRQHLDPGGNLHKLCSRESESDLQSPLVFLNQNSKYFLIERRNHIEEEENDGECGGVGGSTLEEETWMFQAEILRAECNFLRMEREFALKKLERNRVKTERTLRSAVQTLISGRKKIFEGKNVNTVLEKEIEDLSEKLEELHRSSRVKDNAVGNCSNFDTNSFLLQRRIGKLGKLPDENSLNESQGLDTSHDIDKQNYCVSTSQTKSKSTQVDELSKKMEDGLSKGMMLEKALKEEEYGSMLTNAANSIVDRSVSDSKGVVCPNLFSFSTRQELTLPEDNRCSGHCRAIVHRIAEQVRAETEQWSQMQEMLECVRCEMEELQASHDFWEKCSHSSAEEILSLKLAVEEWKGKALSYETRANELELELFQLQGELHKAKTESHRVRNREVKSKENHRFHNGKEESKDLQIIPLGEQLAKERKMLLLGLKDKDKENSRRRKVCSNSSGLKAPQRAPLQDIRNSAFLNLP